MQSFRAFRIHADDDDYRAGIENLTLDDLTPGEVVVESHYSSVNYKDALAGTGKEKILRCSPLVGGIDVSGVVVASEDPRFQPGARVLVTGCGLGEVHDGGYAERMRVPADWVVPLPDGLDLFEAMALGTAGFTAALAIQRMEDNHQTKQHGPILVTGATGGVGSLAVDMLSTMGYEVTALTGKSESEEYLKTLGATEVLNRHELQMSSQALEKARWGGAIDNVGGKILSWLTRTTKPWGNIVSIGLAAGAGLDTTVMPFILRGVSLLGVSSSNCPLPWRKPIWDRLATDLRPRRLDKIVAETVTMEQLSEVFAAMLAGKIQGRVVVKIKQET